MSFEISKVDYDKSMYVVYNDKQNHFVLLIEKTCDKLECDFGDLVSYQTTVKNNRNRRFREGIENY